MKMTANQTKFAIFTLLIISILLLFDTVNMITRNKLMRFVLKGIILLSIYVYVGI